MPEQFDAVVVGSGQAGNPLVVALAGAGLKCAIVEQEHVGGTCVNVGCTPTKTLWNSGRVAYLARRAADYGVDVGPVHVDMPAVRRRKQGIVDEWRSGSERQLANAPGLELIRGQAQFTGPRLLAVNGRELSAERIFINAGCRPARPRLRAWTAWPRSTPRPFRSWMSYRITF